MNLANSFIFPCNVTTKNESPSPSSHLQNLMKFSSSASFLGLPARRGELASAIFVRVKSFWQSSWQSYMTSSRTRSLHLRTLHFTSSDHLSLRWMLQYFKIVSLWRKTATLTANLLSACFLSAMYGFPQNTQSTFQLKLSTDFHVETFETFLATSATQTTALFLLRMMFPTCLWQLMWIKTDWFSCYLLKGETPALLALADLHILSMMQYHLCTHKERHYLVLGKLHSVSRWCTFLFLPFLF